MRQRIPKTSKSPVCDDDIMPQPSFLTTISMFTGLRNTHTCKEQAALHGGTRDSSYVLLANVLPR